ncbi:MAG: thiolase family protein, partial [Actinomycetota bacterium]|nr:thiolase family protein [Actinomycetota bacterium]
MEKVAIIGVAQSKYEQNKPETFAEMVYDVTRRALEDAGITKDEVDNVVSVSSDFWDGRTISSMAIQDSACAYGKD